MIKKKPPISEILKKTKLPLAKVEKQETDIMDDTQQLTDTKTKDNKSDIPRPPNAFMIFATEWRKKLAVEHPGRKPFITFYSASFSLVFPDFFIICKLNLTLVQFSS